MSYCTQIPSFEFDCLISQYSSFVNVSNVRIRNTSIPLGYSWFFFFYLTNVHITNVLIESSNAEVINILESQQLLISNITILNSTQSFPIPLFNIQNVKNLTITEFNITSNQIALNEFMTIVSSNQILLSSVRLYSYVITIFVLFSLSSSSSSSPSS